MGNPEKQIFHFGVIKNCLRMDDSVFYYLLNKIYCFQKMCLNQNLIFL